MSITCSSCGGKLTDSDRFCPACGTARAPGAAPTATNETSSGWDRVLARLREATAGEYTIVRQIGRGGMAAVFLAVDTALNRNVAIKVLSPVLLMAEDMAERFREEAITIARLDHPNIITIHGVRRLEDLHFFVMKYVEGRPLDYIIRNIGPLSVPLVQGIVAQVAPALSYAHSHGVIHRDVKPANLLVESTGRLIVSDFGIAKVSESPGLTQTGSMVGTAAYMSPEQCAGGTATAASDQYSLAIVLYELLTARPPFSGTPLQIIQAHTHGEIAPLRSKRPDCPPEFEKALHRMLARKPADRWASLEEAQAALGADARANTEDTREKLARLATPDPDVTQMLSAAALRGRVPHSGRRRPTDPARIVIQNVPGELETGERTSLAGLVVDATGSTLEREVEWSSTSPNVVTVEGNPPTLTAIGPGTARIRAVVRGATVSADVGITVVEARTCTLELSATALNLEVGERNRITAVARDRRGASLATTIGWTSANPAVAAVSAGGIVTGHAEGRTQLTAVAGEIHRLITVTVEPARVATLLVSPATASIVIGDSLRIEAMPRDARGASLADREVTWSSRSPTVASVSAEGVVIGVEEGSAEVVAGCEGAAATVALRVAAPPLARLELEGVPDGIWPGQRFRLTAYAINIRGQKFPVDVEWWSARSRVAPVSRDGVVEARRPGVAAIVARCGGLESKVELNVLRPVAQVSSGESNPVATRKRRIAVIALAGVAVVAVPFLATKIMSTPRQVDDAPATSTSPTTREPQIPEGVTNLPGPLGQSEPRDSVSGAQGGDEPSPILVLDSPSREIAVGDSMFVDAEFRGGTSAASAPRVTWSSSNARVATVSATGLVRGIAPGTARIRARTALTDDSVTVTVNARRVAVRTVEITPPGASLIVGDSLTLQARTLDADGRPLTDRMVVWTSSNRAIATVNPQTGEVIGLRPGTASITAESEIVRMSVLMTVAERPVAAGEPEEEPVRSEALSFTAVTAGGGTCASAADNRVFCWGFAGSGIQTDGSAFDMIAAGWNHRCALRDGRAFCWGANDHGQLGNGSTTNRNTPTAVSGDLRLIRIATGQFHTCALDAQGVAYCWGENDAGQLGTGSTRDATTPTRVNATAPFTAITAGRAHTCAIERGGRAWCWGDGLAGELGNGMTHNQSKPFPLNEKFRFHTISAGDDFTCALTDSGRAMCWGNNRDGQLGDTRNRMRDEPSEVARIPAFQMITTGRHHACGLSSDGRIHCWGSNQQGQLGTGTTSTANAPSPVESQVHFTAVSAGTLHTCARSDNGTVYCWGDNSHGQINAGGAAYHPTPVAVRITG